jgi:hypothetical protein
MVDMLDLVYQLRNSMPVISTFYGIIIRMNFVDHNPPHFHAEYQGFKAAFNIQTGKLAAGDFPTNAKKLVETWAKLHRAE